MKLHRLNTKELFGARIIDVRQNTDLAIGLW